jgi:hypothetical protein
MSRAGLVIAIVMGAGLLLPSVARGRTPQRFQRIQLGQPGRDGRNNQVNRVNQVGSLVPVRVNRVGSVAVAVAARRAEKRKGGFFRYGWRVSKGSLLTGGLGAGVGYFVGGPGVAMDWGRKGAGMGCAISSMSTAGSSGVYKRSDRCFAKAVLAEANGQQLKKHWYKMKGIVLSGVESGATNAVTMGGFGLFFSGPTGVLPSAGVGAAVGGTLGVAFGATRAYAVPFFKRRSLGWSLGRASRALGKLEKDPSSAKWQAAAKKHLAKVRAKKDNIPLISKRHARRYGELIQRAQRLGQRAPGLSALAATLR